jgi:hypothetical protein
MIPVLWVSHDPEILNHGYADQAMLDAILNRSLWTPSDPLEFVQQDVHGDFPDVEGAVVILGSRNHVGHEDWFVEQLDRLAWSVVILTSEEEWVFDWRKIEQSDTRRLWVMQGRPEHDGAVFLPCGWYPGTREGLVRDRSSATPRSLDWFFGGQITHERREQMADALLDGRISGFPGRFIGTEGYFQGIDQQDYFSLVADAKIIPCPSGPQSLCTARVEEALEAGAVPILDMVKPTDPQNDYWRMLFGEHPFPTIYDWETLPDVMAEVLDDWPAISNRCWSFWQLWKRQTAKRLDADVRAVSGVQRTFPTPDDAITAIITTSPTQMHPDTSHLQETVDSIRVHLPHCEVIIVADGVRPEQEHLREQYDEYLNRVCWLTNFHWHNVVPFILPEWGHQANAVRAALELVDTPLILFAEHDTPLKETEIDWEGIVAFVRSGEANLVRFHHEAEVLAEHEHLMLDDEAQRYYHERVGCEDEQGEVWMTVLVETGRVPARRTVAWWQRPHVASTHFYRTQVMPFFTEASRTMVEDPLYGHILDEYHERGEAAWWDWRLFVYAPEGSMQRSYHLNSRGDAPKYSMKFR